jgi:hypothetical protein
VGCSVAQAQLALGRGQLREYTLFVENADADRHKNTAQSDRAMLGRDGLAIYQLT